MRRSSYRSSGSGFEAFGAFIGFFIIWFAVACFGAWTLMIALGNGHDAGMWPIAPGFWDTFSVTIWLGLFMALYSSSSSSNS